MALTHGIFTDLTTTDRLSDTASQFPYDEGVKASMVMVIGDGIKADRRPDYSYHPNQ